MTTIVQYCMVEQGLSKSSEVLQNILLKNGGQSDVNAKEFKKIIRTFSISKFQPYHKHDVH